MQAVILAGGSGTKLHSFTANTPKPLTPVFDRPAMEYLVELLARHHVRELVVVVSSASKAVMDHFGDGAKWGVDIRYSIEEAPKGTAGDVKGLQPILDDTFLVVPGDAVTDLDLTEAIDYHRRKSALATILLHKAQDPTEFGVVATTADGLITRFVEKPKVDDVFSNVVNTGIYVFEPEVLSSIPYDTNYDFGRELFPRLLRNMEPVFGCEMQGYWCDIGIFAHYRNAHFDALTGKANLNISGTEVEEGIWVAEDAEVHSSVQLSAPLFLGSGAEVRRNVSVGGLTVVGSDTLVDEAASLQRSIVGSGAFIGRASKVRDCVIGDGYRLSDHGDVHNRIVTMAGDKIAPIDWDDDVPSLSLSHSSLVNA